MKISMKEEKGLGQILREKFNSKLEEMKTIKRQINFLDSESLDLTEEISRLVREIEFKQLYER